MKEMNDYMEQRFVDEIEKLRLDTREVKYNDLINRIISLINNK